MRRSCSPAATTRSWPFGSTARAGRLRSLPMPLLTGRHQSSSIGRTSTASGSSWSPGLPEPKGRALVIDTSLTIGVSPMVEFVAEEELSAWLEEGGIDLQVVYQP